MKYTKGPWFADDCAVEPLNAPMEKDIAITARGVIATLPPINNKTRANARLIASAPELLEACKVLKEEMQTVCDECSKPTKTIGIRKAEQAISKAEEA